MTALAGDRLKTRSRTGRKRNFSSLAASVTIYEGAIVSMDLSGYARPARATATDKVLGVCTKRATNTGSAGTVAGGVDVEQDDLYCFVNSAGADAITKAHVGLSCYVVDDQTVALTDALGVRPRAGKIADVTTDGVFVDFAAKPTFSTVKVSITDVSTASDSSDGRAPIGGVIVKVFSRLGGAITLVDSVVTPKIGATAITGGALTVAFTGSAADDIDVAYPTALNRVAAGDKLIASTGGESTGTQTLDVYFVIEQPA